jgi:hypothetical protein
MLSIGLWRWYINVTITILDIIHRPNFYLKHDYLEAGFCLRLQVEPTPRTGLRDWLYLLGPTEKFHLKTETDVEF